MSWGDLDITLRDTPGHADFSAETERALRVSDYVILVISGTDGVQSHTETLWNLIKRYNKPAFIFITKMDVSNMEGLKLENQICFPLYACSKEIIRRYKPYLDELNLTYTQYITMIVLWEKKSQSVKELGEVLFLDSGTLTPVLKKLEAKGYLTRTRSMEDERSLIVTITKKGEDLKTKAAGIPKRLGECVNMKPEDAEKLYELLYTLLKLISDKEE